MSADSDAEDDRETDLADAASAVDPAPWLSRHLLPRPARVEPGLALHRSLGPLAVDDGAAPWWGRAVARANAQLSHERPPLTGPPLAVRCVVSDADEAYPALDADCSYQLDVSEAGVSIAAATTWGARAALATLTQYLSVQGQLHGLHVEDRPAFWLARAVVGSGTALFVVAGFKRTVVAMAAFKLNTLHLHLSDDQGFRFPTRRWPNLVSRIAYSRTELQELVSFAADHGVRVVPELDVPGHVTAWLAAYPQLGLEGVGPTERFGVHRAALNPTDGLVFTVLADLLDELVEVFPDQCLHLGGDEVHPEAWAALDGTAPGCVSEDVRVSDPRDLQGWFTAQLVSMVLARQRTPVLWDEALHERLASFGPELIVMCWRGATWRDRILNAGHRCVVTAGAYLDLNYPAAWHYAYDPCAPQAELLALEDSLLERSSFAAVAEGMRWTHQWRAGPKVQAGPEVHASPEERAAFGADPLVIGAEACQWGEIVDGATLDARLWGRLPAVAELWWSMPGALAPETLYERLLLAHSYLEDTGLVPLGAAMQRQANRLGIDWHWQRLLAWLEPVKWYGRLLGEAALAARIAGSEMPQARPYTVATTLDKLVDWVPPESLATRQQFEPLLGEDLAATGMRYLLAQWEDLLSRPAPEGLQVHASKLAQLLALLQREINEGEPVRLEELEALVTATDDLQLAPVHALVDYLNGRVRP